MAAALISIVPGYISRSVAGSYDNEGIAIFCMLLTYYFWIKSVKTGSIYWSTACALAYFYMVRPVVWKDQLSRCLVISWKWSKLRKVFPFNIRMLIHPSICIPFFAERELDLSKQVGILACISLNWMSDWSTDRLTKIKLFIWWSYLARRRLS